MLGKTNDTENAKSVISSDMKIKGKISADGDLVLLGSVVGGAIGSAVVGGPFPTQQVNQETFDRQKYN